MSREGDTSFPLNDYMYTPDPQSLFGVTKDIKVWLQEITGKTSPDAKKRLDK
jgi:hypothetical protein